jgi:translation initiation factor 4A
MNNPENNTFFTEWEESFDSFDQMGLHENLLRGIYSYGE